MIAMPIKVLVNGAFGRMGQMTQKAISSNPAFELVGQTGKEYDLKKSIIDSKAEVVIDFTHPDTVFTSTTAIIDAGARPIIGTTGLTLDQVHKLQDMCAKIKRGGIIAPNFSLGAILMMKYAREVAKYMPNVEIIEAHHNNKAESPSGTSMRTAEMLLEGNPNLNQNGKASKDIVPGARGGNYKQIPIHAVRLPGFLAQQQVVFGNSGETLTIQHSAIDRECFMPGVCLACEKVMSLDHLVYGLDEVL
jgi:4-hydroxy-tetrahydrodipicolinate reductase